jgi:hypothetical protein
MPVVKSSPSSTSIISHFPARMTPARMMLTGRHFDDAMLLRIADAYERNFDWHKDSCGNCEDSMRARPQIWASHPGVNERGGQTRMPG